MGNKSEALAIYGGIPVRDKFLPYGKQFVDEADIQAVRDVLRSDFLTTGPAVSAFENDLKEITGAEYALAVSNGTAALHAACFAAGIKEGDEVIVTPLTFAASANCVLYCGGTPVFADVNEDDWNINPRCIREKISSKTKAVIAVDFTGQTPNLFEIKEICKENNLVFIEDAAHSIGTKWGGKSVGNIADMTTFSFHPVKTVTAGEGGAVTTNNEEFYKRLDLFRTHGIIRSGFENGSKKTKGAWYYEQKYLGYNYRLTDIQSALCSSQLKKLNMFAERRFEITQKYNNAFCNMEEIILQKNIDEESTVRHLYIIRLDLSKIDASRDEVFDALRAENIGANLHYIPVYLHPYYQSLGYKEGLCPIAEEIYNGIITLPLFYSMSDSDVDDVIESVKKVINYFSKF